MIKRLLTGLISVYKIFISPVLPPSCRFYPSCSEYAMEAVDTHGALRGAALAAKRLLRCQPFNPGGYDPVPSAHCVSAGLEGHACGGQRLNEPYRHNGL